MKIRFWLGSAWAAIKGLLAFGTTPKLAVIDYIFDFAYGYYSKIEWIVRNVAKAYKGLVWICDALDVYDRYVPEPWMPYYEAVVNSLRMLKNMLADGKIERSEIEKVVKTIRDTYETWRN